MKSATIRPKITNTGKLSNRIWFRAVDQVNQITCNCKLCTPREPIILYYNFCTRSVLFSAVQLWINCTAFSQSNLSNFAQHVIAILTNTKTHFSVFSVTCLSPFICLAFRILNDYNSTIINFMFLPLIFGLSIIAEIWLQIRTKRFYFQKYVNNARKFDHSKNVCLKH